MSKSPDYRHPCLVLYCHRCGKPYQMTALSELDTDEDFCREISQEISQTFK